MTARRVGMVGLSYRESLSRQQSAQELYVEHAIHYKTVSPFIKSHKPMECKISALN
jgi:hypothetical protein